MLTQEKLKDLLTYDADTGIFRWNKPRPNARSGDIAGTITDQGYIKINILYRKYRAHHLAFLYMNGTIPTQVDHINHIRNDNRWNNLRPTSHAENKKNMSRYKTNKSKTTGVIWDKRFQKWRATIGASPIHLGYFNTHYAAAYCRHYAEIINGYHKNHGI